MTRSKKHHPPAGPLQRSIRYAAMPRRADRRKPGAAAPGAGDDDDPVPSDPDVFRFALVRRMYTFLGMWRTCRVAACRRSKTCVGRSLRCAADNPMPPVSRAEEAQRIGDLHDAVKRALAERDAARAATADDRALPPARRASARARGSGPG